MKVSKVNGKCNICGMRFREIRKKQGLSQEQTAAKLQLAGMNITQKAISRMETGKRVIVDYELKYLAEALDITINELFEIAGK